MSTIKPWARGPFELLKHAEGHLKAGTDFDKRMALISFDNAVEVSITTFLQLHPKQRGNRVYKREQVASWQANYHSKLDFLYDHYLTEPGISTDVTRDEVIWYHDLRNQLYHSGNGMVPEESSLAGARQAANWVFSVLYGVDAKALLKTEVSAPAPVPEKITISPNSQMLFLTLFMSFEKLLREAMGPSLVARRSRHGVVTVRELWDEFKRQYGVNKVYDDTVLRANDLRNQLSHGRLPSLMEDEIGKLGEELLNVRAFVRAHVPDARSPETENG